MANEEVVPGETPANEAPTTSTKPKSTAAPASLADLPAFLTVDEVAELLRTTRAAVYTMSDRGRLPGVTRVGRRMLVSRDDLVDWLKQNRVPSPSKGVRR